MDQTPERTGAPEAALGGFAPATRAALVPPLAYKSVFLGEWFREAIRQERDESVRVVLEKMAADTLREAIELLATMRAWERADRATLAEETLRDLLQRLLMRDLLALKEGSNEILVLLAMRAPNDELRRRVLWLADLDRQHADELRALLGTARVPESVMRAPTEGSPLGAHQHRDAGSSLGAEVRKVLEAIRAKGDEPMRLVVSHVALRHLRDEGRIEDDGTCCGVVVDVDFGWRGECFSVVTAERVRLSEILSLEAMPDLDDA